MEKLLLIIVLLIVCLIILLWFTRNFRIVKLNTIADLGSYTGGAGQITIVNDREGGVFFPYTGTRPADGGVVVADGKGRLWLRDYNPALGVNPWWWQAKGDGKNDDLPALNRMLGYVTMNGTFGEMRGEEFFRPKIVIPDGIFRVTGQWKIGGQPVSGTDAVLYQCAPNYGAPSSNTEEWTKGGRTLPVTIECSSRGFIWGDFKPKELTAIVSYGCFAYQYGGVSSQTARVSGLNILGYHKQDYNFIGDKTNQIGLLILGSKLVTFENCSFFGCQYGKVDNMAYQTCMIQNFFGNCGTGFFTIGSHCSTGTMLSADHCNLGFEFISGACSWQQLSSEQCIKALIVGGNNNVFNGGYLEQLDNTSGQDDYQLNVGYPEGHWFYNRETRPEAITFNNFLVTHANTILVDDNALDVRFSGVVAHGRCTQRNPDTAIYSDRNSFTIEQTKKHE